MAWLNATPRPAAGSDTQSPPKPKKTRREQLEAQGAEIDGPPNPAPEIIAWLFEAGPAGHAGMGATALSWAEITEWQRNSGVRLMPWQARLLRRLSRDYVAQASKAEEPDCPAPWSRDPTPAESETHEQMLRFMMGFRQSRR